MNKKFLVDAYNNKLFNNLQLYENVIRAELKSNIYQLYYRFKFDTLIIDHDSLNNSIYSFCLEFGHIVSIFIHINTLIAKISEDDIKQYGQKLKFIINENYINHYNFNNTIVLQNNTINNKLYDIYKNKNNLKKDNICCFLDNIETPPNELTKLLYPKSKLKIRMFNNNTIKHIQNLGTISEIDRWDILAESQFYMNLNKEYTTEAKLLGCKIIYPESITENFLTEDKNDHLPEYKTYKELLEQCAKI